MKCNTKTVAFALVAVAMSSCSKTADLYDSTFAETEQKNAFAENFKKAYPNVSLDQDWDFSTGQVNYSLPVSGSNATTRALTRANSADCTTGTFQLEGSVSDYMHENMMAGVNNVEKGTPFYMKVPENPFTIVPFFQGTAGYTWELWMNVEGVGDIKIWSKGEGLKYKKTKTSNWVTVTKSTAVPDQVAQIEACSYTFSNLPVGANMYFYMKVNTGKTEFIVSSLNQMMLTLEGFPTPENLPENNTAMIVGVEDNPSASGDKDYEDLAFMVYGNPYPPKYRPEIVVEGTTKRYMMEDLGTTDDFDFNDVVVDVTYDRVEKTLKYLINDDGTLLFTGEITSQKKLPTIAKVRAMGGTRDFTLTIGQTTWTKSSKFVAGTMYNTQSIDADAVLDEFEVTGFNAASNNVSVAVAGNGESAAVMNVIFPKRGEAPMMIAVDESQAWMKERVSIPASWWTE